MSLDDVLRKKKAMDCWKKFPATEYSDPFTYLTSWENNKDREFFKSLFKQEQSMKKCSDKPKCKCGKACQYYGKVGGYSSSCKSCNEKNANRQREARKKKKANPWWIPEDGIPYYYNPDPITFNLADSFMKNTINIQDIHKKIDEIPGICSDGKKGVRAVVVTLLEQLGVEVEKPKSLVGMVYEQPENSYAVILSRDGYNHVFLSGGKYYSVGGGMPHHNIMRDYKATGRNYKEYIRERWPEFAEVIIERVEKDAEETSGGIK